MIALHGSWLPQLQFFVWAEALAPTEDRDPTSPPPAHPRAVEPAFLAELGLVGQPAWRTATLPCVAGRPVPAPIRGMGTPAPVEGRAEPSPVALPGLLLEPLDALMALTDLSLPPSVAVGDDWRFWVKVGQLALELLGRERFLPAISLTGDAPRAYWRVLTSERQDAERLGALALAMPMACRAFAQPPAEARQLLLSALDQFVDSAARAWAPELDPIPALAMPGGRMNAGQRWFEALRHPGDNAIELEPIEVVTLAQHLSTWTAPLMPPPEAPFRTCFRLEAPPEGAPANASWRLEFALQASDDPSLIIPAAQVWRGSGAEAGFLARRFERPQERLLEDLGRASKVFPPLTRGLSSAHPEAVELQTAEAHRFLREAAPGLEEQGFGVLLPPWWRSPRTRLGVKVMMREEQGPGKVGQQALVSYDWALSLGDETLDREAFMRLVSMKQPLLKVGQRWVELDGAQVEEALKFFEERQGGHMSVLEAVKLAALPEGAVGGLPIVGVEAEGKLGEFLGAFGQGDWMASRPAPEGFQGTLRPYQERGFAWMDAMRTWGMGACLADDMGLGKTIQILALLLEAKAVNVEGERMPFLLVCPTSVVGNWCREARSFGPKLKVHVHHGAARKKGTSFASGLKGVDLVVTTYALLHRDVETLATVAWQGAIFDEAQNLKNAGAKQAQAARQLQAAWKVALTGTPVENRLADLWAILDLLNPGYLGSASAFRAAFAAPIEKFKDQEAGQRLRQLVKPFVLRRLKTDPTIIQDLPEKNEQKVFCPLTKEQASLYQAVVNDMLAKIEGAAGIQRKGHVLACMTKLKQIADHPGLFLDDFKGELSGRSGKLARLSEMLEEVASVGDRALVFTQFAEMGHMLQRHLEASLGEPIPFLHGGVPAAERERMVRTFQEAPKAAPAMILSLKAGGVGLNLTRANHVFHFDRWWNPAVEEQATDRAFRIGQKRNVMVHKFMCLGTLEERIDGLLEDKKALSSLVVGEGEGWLTELSTDQLRDILALRDEAIAVD